MIAPPIRVLLTEDVPADAELELRELKRAGLRVTHHIVDSEEAFVAALRDYAPDVILSDFSMPGFDGMSALALAREHAPQVPFVFVSGTIGEEYAIRALKSGATDYVLKTNLVRLPAAVERALADAHEHAELQRLSRIRDIVSRINSALVRLREREALFDEICRIAVDIGGFTGAHVAMLDVPTGLVRPMARRGRSAEGAKIEEAHAALGAVARALLTAQPAIWNNIERDAGPVEREHFLAHGVAAVASFPLVVEGSAIGAFSLHAAETGFFDESEIAMLDELTANISFALELIGKQERISYLAFYDSLTALPNRALFHEQLTQALAAAQARRGTLALALIDLERFQAINDTLGQQVGDRVLCGVAARLREAAGNLGHVARLGSDLFAMVFEDLGSAEDVARRIERETAKVVGEAFQIDATEVRLSAKAGIALFPEDGADADMLLRNAEASLKRAKETGERYLFYAPHINARVAEQVELESRLRKAVERGELYLHYQPKIELTTGRLVGLEALMRWKGPEGVPVPPIKFVPVLEQTGLILEAGRQVIASASAAHRDWRLRGLNPPRIAVNVSALQLRRRGFATDVLAALGAQGEDGGGVDVEITESLLMSDVEESIRKLRELRDAGLRIALDDFGTGYSSLAYLSKLPLDTLKIDRSFIRGMIENAGDTIIVSAIISLAQSLRLNVVAEGVESEAQAQVLRELRCDQAQGYLFSPPVAAERIEALLKGAPA